MTTDGIRLRTSCLIRCELFSILLRRVDYLDECLTPPCFFLEACIHNFTLLTLNIKTLGLLKPRRPPPLPTTDRRLAKPHNKLPQSTALHLLTSPCPSSPTR
jgi:hypothetical protein